MLTKLVVRNFKSLSKVEIELGNPVVLVGPNNSGKTSTLQALALWHVGIKRWLERRKGPIGKRPGVAINRRDVVAVPVPEAKLLWRNLHVRDVRRSGTSVKTNNVRIDIRVEGVAQDKAWTCGMEFDYANDESIYCRPLRDAEGTTERRIKIPEEAAKIEVALLPPMSGLASNEVRLDPGAVNTRVGEGRTAEVLRNLCYRVCQDKPDKWKTLCEQVHSLFGVEIGRPKYVEERGEVWMDYVEHNIHLDLSCSGRGLQQTLLLLSYMYANPNAVLLLDEPDAHLEILRQRQVYELLTETARRNGNQIIAASHSEVLLNEAADRDVVVAFVGKPHRIDDRKSQVLKALREIGFEDYYLAQQTKWILYLEGSNDLAILRAFAEKLKHARAKGALERPFVRYRNQFSTVQSHFYGLREAEQDLLAVALLDRQEKEPPSSYGIEWLLWKRREIENYLCMPEVLLAFAEKSAAQEGAGPLFARGDINRHRNAMQESVEEVSGALKILQKGSPWDADTKVSDDFLVPLFEKFFEKLKLPNLMAKKNFHELARFVPADKLDSEVREKLDKIVEMAERAKALEEHVS